MRFLALVLWDAYTKFNRDDGWAISSHIALSALLSLFPFLIFVAAVAGFFGTPEAADRAAAFLFEMWPKQMAAPIAAEIHNVLLQPRGGLLTFGVVLALYFSGNAVEALRIGLARAYDVTETRPWWARRIEVLLYVLLAAVSLLVITVLLVLAPPVFAYLERAAPPLANEFELAYQTVRFGASFLAMAASLLVAHKFLAPGERSLLDIAPGVLTTLLGWLGYGSAFGAFLSQFAKGYVSTYAGLASIMISLVFLYWLGALMIFGAELNQALLRARSRRS
ncbi:MAG TPA: YihY/virulence factor BrkB family protein [Methylocystis sp.]|nr:YihY/virulence factor BrkB family protein [Methylocystis sp.]